jgi:hypothetical protein
MSSRRAQSWVYDVLNVFIESLETEVRLLSRGNTTWRFHSQDLEHIWPLEAYLDRDGRHILRDLLTAHPELGERISTHDALRAQLAQAATRAYHEALGNPAVRNAVEDARRRFLERLPGATPEGAYPPEKHVDIVIEHVINAVKDLPSHHTDAEFWRAHGQELSSLSIPSLLSVRKSRGDLLAHDQEMLQWLGQLSYQLCEQFDIPAAPSRSASY